MDSFVHPETYLVWFVMTLYACGSMDDLIRFLLLRSNKIEFPSEFKVWSL